MNNSEAQSSQSSQSTQPTQPTLPPRPIPYPTTSEAHSPRLTPTSTTSTTSTTSEVKPEKPGSLIGSRFKGIARIIHGAGEAVRGYGMSTLDNAISNKARGAAENGEITRRGQEEIQRGLDDLKWKSSSSD